MQNVGGKGEGGRGKGEGGEQSRCIMEDVQMESS